MTQRKGEVTSLVGAQTAVHESTGTRHSRPLGWLLTVGGSIGLIAAVVLLIEKVAMIRDPDYIPTCTINPVLSCGSVMTTSQAEAFGFPNPIIGIAGFAIVVVLGVALLRGFRPSGWQWGVIQAGVTFGVGFVTWLIYQSLYQIGALCPYCMVVWAVMIPIFVYTTARVLTEFGAGTRSPVVTRLAGAVTEYRAAILTTWILVIVVLIAHRFWDYWTTLL